MKKQIIFTSLLTILVLVLGLTGSVFATSIETTGDTIDSLVEPRTSENGYTPENDQTYGVTLPENETQGTTLNEELQNSASTEESDNRGAIVAGIVIITILLIAVLIIWWYKTNY